MYFVTVFGWWMCCECICLILKWINNLLNGRLHGVVMTLWNCFILCSSVERNQTACFICYYYLIMCNLSHVRKNQNLWNMELYNLFIAVVFESLFLAWRWDVLEYPCCSLGIFQCSNLEANWRRTLKWISQKYLCCGIGSWMWAMNVPLYGLWLLEVF